MEYNKIIVLYYKTTLNFYKIFFSVFSWYVFRGIFTVTDRGTDYNRNNYRGK